MQHDAGIEYLLRSDNRTALLLALEQDQPLDRYEIEDRLSASRRTVTRVLGELTEQGHIRESAAGYRLTTFGAIVADAYRQCRERTDIARRYRPLLANVDSETTDFEPEYLEGADLTVATDVNPYAPRDRMLELRQSASWVRAVMPVIEKRSIEQLADRVDSGDTLRFEVVIPADLYEMSQSHPEYGEPFRTAAAADSIEKFVYPGPITTLYAVTDDIAVLGASVDGEPHALVESANPELREWVIRRIDAYQDEAVPLDSYRQ
jgi:predicted transcriptional regulator